MLIVFGTIINVMIERFKLYKKGTKMNQQDITNLINNSSKLIGTRQVLKAIMGNTLQLVVIAKDTDSGLKEQILHECSTKNIPVVECFTKQELGSLAGIDVMCACIGILN